MPKSKNKREKRYVPKGVIRPDIQTFITETVNTNLGLLETASLIKLRKGESTKEEMTAMHNLFNAVQFMIMRRRKWLFGDDTEEYYNQVKTANAITLEAYARKEEGKTETYEFNDEQASFVLDTIEACTTLVKDEVKRAPLQFFYDFYGGILLRVGYANKEARIRGEELADEKTLAYAFKKAKELATLTPSQRRYFMEKWGIIELNEVCSGF